MIIVIVDHFNILILNNKLVEKNKIIKMGNILIAQLELQPCYGDGIMEIIIIHSSLFPSDRKSHAILLLW